MAKEQNVPPYVIFPDRTLTEMAIAKLTTEAALLDISGVGHAKLFCYGETFLIEIIRASN